MVLRALSQLMVILLTLARQNCYWLALDVLSKSLRHVETVFLPLVYLLNDREATWSGEASAGLLLQGPTLTLGNASSCGFKHEGACELCEDPEVPVQLCLCVRLTCFLHCCFSCNPFFFFLTSQLAHVLLFLLCSGLKQALSHNDSKHGTLQCVQMLRALD